MLRIKTPFRFEVFACLTSPGDKLEASSRAEEGVCLV